jgi:hypothetical protein
VNKNARFNTQGMSHFYLLHTLLLPGLEEELEKLKKDESLF